MGALSRVFRPFNQTAPGGVIGTTLGARLLGRLPQQMFRRVIAVLLIALGLSIALAGKG